jgi:hypothetical protein
MRKVYIDRSPSKYDNKSLKSFWKPIKKILNKENKKGIQKNTLSVLMAKRPIKKVEIYK